MAVAAHEQKEQSYPFWREGDSPRPTIPQLREHMRVAGRRIHSPDFSRFPIPDTRTT